MADLKRVDCIVAELSKNPEFRALGQMIRTADNKGERDALVKRARAEISRLLIELYYPRGE